MGEKPLLSVIVPVYNSRHTLAGVLAAVQAQEGFAPGEVELIVVDDGSTDGSAAVAEGKCNLFLRNERNEGAAAARNRGARAAQGDILVFLDADVIPAPGALEALYHELVSGPGIAAAVGRYTAQPAAPGVVNLYHNVFTRYHHDLSSGEIDWFWGALGAVKEEAFRAVGGFDERYEGASAEDMELGRALAEKGYRIRYCPAAEGAHARNFTLRSMLANDYKKAVLGMKLRLAGRLPRRAPGFVTRGNLLTAPFLVAMIVLLPAAFMSPLYLLIESLLLGVVLLENEGFYRCLSLHLPGQAGKAVFLHWVQMFVISAGAAAGFLGWLLRRPAYGKPGWI